MAVVGSRFGICFIQIQFWLPPLLGIQETASDVSATSQAACGLRQRPRAQRRYSEIVHVEFRIAVMFP